MTWWQNPHLASLLPSAPVPLLTFPVTLPVSLLVICVVWGFTAPLEALIRSGWWGSGPVGSSFSYADLVVVSQRLKVLLNFTCSELLRRSWISSSALKIEVCRKEINKFPPWLKEEGCAGVFLHHSWEIWKVSPDQVLFFRVFFLSVLGNFGQNAPKRFFQVPGKSSCSEKGPLWGWKDSPAS